MVALETPDNKKMSYILLYRFEKKYISWGEMSEAMKTEVYKKIVRSSLVYGGKTWPLKAKPKLRPLYEILQADRRN